MAPVNPSLNPSNDPNFLSYSRGISVPDTMKPQGQADASVQAQGARFQGPQYEGAKYEGNKHVDTSGQYAGQAAAYAGQAQGIAAKASGELIADLAGEAVLIAKGVDTVIKDDIDNTTYQAVDREREGFKASLQAAAGVKPTKMDVLSADDQANIPAEVESVGQTVGNLSAAREGGKISATAYYARLDSVASSIRARYPGYREYIDKEISKVSGVDPANAYIKSLMGDINRAQAASAGAQNKTVSMLNSAIKEGIPGAWAVKDRFLNGKMNSTGVDKWINENQSIEYNLKLRASVRADNKGTQEEQDRTATQDAYFEGTTKGYQAFNTITLGADTTKKISDFVTEVQSGKATASDEQMTQLAPIIMAAKQQAMDSMLQGWSKKEGDGPDARSMIQKLGGPAKARQLADDSTKMFDKVYDAINSKDYGAAFSHMRANEAIRKDADYGLLNDPDLKGYTRLMSAMEKYPEYAKKFFQYGLTKDMDAKFATKFNKDSAELQSQPDFRITGVPTTIGKKLNELTTKGVRSESPEGKKINAALVNLPTLIGDKSTPDEFKVGLIHGAFSDNTAINQVVRDGRDPVTGRPIPGKFSVFQSWTSPEVTKEIIRLDAQDPSQNLWPKYKNWAENTFQNQLFRQEALDLNTFQLSPDMKISYDDTNHHFKLDFGKNVGVNDYGPQLPKQGQLFPTPVDRAAALRAQDSIERLNKGIDSISNIAKAGNDDVDSYVLKSLISMGFDPTVTNPKGIPQHMVQAIMTARKKEKKEPLYK